jgi:hypothetical protein
MFSKKSVSRALVAFLVFPLTLTGCDIKLGEEPPPPDAQGFGSACLSKVGDVAEKFMQGTANDIELQSSWTCVTSAVDDFRRYVRGRSDDRYTSAELASFLEKNFLETGHSKISPELQLELMKFKQLFVGGSSEYLTRNELGALGDVLGMFQAVSLRLNPYMIVLSLNWKVNGRINMQRDMAYFEQANQELQEAAKTIATQVEKNTQTYVLNDFAKLLREFANFSGSNWELPNAIERYMPLVQKVKKALAGGDERVIAPKEWRRFTVLGARGYIQFLRYSYFIKSVPETGSGYRLSYLARTMDDLLSVFQDMVSEKPEGVVTRAEISDLLTTFEKVWPDFRVSDDLILEGMKLKQLFFGGSVESLNAMDFDTARLKVSRVKALIERFMPYYPVYGGEWDPSEYSNEEAQKFFMESQFVLEATGRELGSLFEGAYDLNDFYKLIKESERLYPPKDSESSFAKQVKNALPLVIDAKNMLFGGNDTSLARGSWSILLGVGARVYSDVLYFDYFLKNRNFNSLENLGSLSVFSNQSLNIVRDVLVVKKTTQFTKAELNTLLMHLVRMGILPKNLTVDSMDGLLQALLNNILNRTDSRLAGKVPNSLTLNSIEVARTELQVWLDMEIFIAELFQDKLVAKDGLSNKALLEAINDKIKDVQSGEYLRAALIELRLTAQSEVPMTIDSQGLLIITNKKTQYFDQVSLRQLNLNRMASRLAIRSFAGDIKRIQNYNGLTLAEVDGAFQKVRKFVVQIGAVDGKSLTFASARFREANMFTPHSDGNELLSYTELADLVGMILSGVNAHTLLTDELVASCLDNKPYTTESELKVSCARKAYRKSMPKVMTADPEYLRYMSKVSEDEWTYYMNNVMKAAGYVPNDRGLARMADLSLVPHVIQYIEMTFAQFDKDKNDNINLREAKDAFGTFKGVLKELAADQLRAGDIEEKDLWDIFTFILKFGKPPESLAEKVRFQFFWKNKPEKWDIWADRTQLAKILGYIADKVAEMELVTTGQKVTVSGPTPEEVEKAGAGMTEDEANSLQPTAN